MTSQLIPEIGQYALIMALLLALVQATIPMIGAQSGNHVWQLLARRTAYGQFFFIAIAYLILSYAFLSDDFSVAYVATNSNTQLPALYKLSAVWGAHEGSLLYWVAVLSAWTVAVALLSHRLPLATMARVLAVLGMISVGFLLFLLFTSNPFDRLLPVSPVNGRDLNPLLQDPGLAIHPPMLYFGYVGFAVAFAFAITALIEGRLDATYARWARPWTLVAWCFLTLGILLGSWWAYRELGWGGYWAWDPVENASLLPWLVGTALIHSLVISEKRNAFQAWTLLLAILAFSLSLMGTFLVRSGVVISVHAFAVDPGRGVFMLAFLGIVIGASLLLFAWRASQVRRAISFQFFSREAFILTNNMLFVVMMITVLLGTLYPLLIESLGYGKLSVGPPYFNLVLLPFMVLILLAMALAPSMRWQNTSLTKVRLKWLSALGISLLLAIAAPLLITNTITWQVILGLTLAFTVALLTIAEVRKMTLSRWGMLLAHLGMAVLVFALVLNAEYSIQKDVRMSAGDKVNVGPYQFKFLGVRPVLGPNYTGEEGGIEVTRDGKEFATLTPEKRLYNVSQMIMSKASIKVSIFSDIYVVMAESITATSFAVRIYYKPFIRWIWYGGLLMILGGLIAALDRRRGLYASK